MKTFLALMLALAALVLPAALTQAQEKQPAKGKLQHVVAFKFKEEATPAQIREVEQAFAGLKKKIREIRAFEWGTNVSPEKLDKGFTHCFLLTFRTAKDRDVYLEHPAHKEFVSLVGPVVADAFVMDYWAR
jgi:hypothetical protein